jgi:hypothetical protein
VRVASAGRREPGEGRTPCVHTKGLAIPFGISKLLEKLRHPNSPKYKRAVQMAFAMPALVRLKSGAYTARKAIPKDVQDEYALLYGQRWEAKLTLSAKLRWPEAKAQYGEWLTEIETRIDTIRARRKGDRQSLSQKQARALAGEWYRWFVAKQEDNPGPPEHWDQAFRALVDRLADYSPELVAEGWKNLDRIVREPEVQSGIRPAMAKEASADQFLADNAAKRSPKKLTTSSSTTCWKST